MALPSAAVILPRDQRSMLVTVQLRCDVCRYDAVPTCAEVIDVLGDDMLGKMIRALEGNQVEGWQTNSSGSVPTDSVSASQLHRGRHARSALRAAAGPPHARPFHHKTCEPRAAQRVIAYPIHIFRSMRLCTVLR